jgi:exodeoxyribonuclease V gamma subunit
VIHLSTSSSAPVLAGRLADVLTTAPADPMTPEWVAVPSGGMRRWLPLQLARYLGATGPGAGDGVAANFDLAYPGSLRTAVLAAGRDPSVPDPWDLERLTWFVLAAMDQHAGDPVLADLTTLPSGASRYARARRVADVFDRYHLHRPDMVRAWAAGAGTDAVGARLPKHHRWQPHLWRLVRVMAGEPSPPERLAGLLERLADGRLEVDLPPRLSFFGLTILPGGSSFLELSRALAATRELHVFLLEASPLLDALAPEVALVAAGHGPRLRSEDTSARIVNHPLLQSWGRLQRESALLIAGARAVGFPEGEVLADPTVASRSDGVLPALQADIRENRRPSGSVRTGSGDDSVRIHACHGATRQVEVVRDAILHLLADDDLGLSEEDILVACPALDRFAPLVEGVFGPSADERGGGGSTADHDHGAEGRAPALRYRIADRSVGDFNAVLAATGDLIELVAGRFEASAVVDFLSQGPVRTRARLSDEQLARIGEWVLGANVRWGLHPEHRAVFGLPASVRNNTWRAATDRLLLGSAVFDGPFGLALGDTAPIGTEGEDVVTLGRLADILERLAVLAEATRQTRPMGAWLALIEENAQALFDVAPEARWQLVGLWKLLDDVRDSVPDGTAAADTLLAFVDVRRVFADRLGAMTGRPDFFRGGITVSSLTPLRGIPYRVVCLLGMDEQVLSAPMVDGDDLVALAPVLGDPDARADDRLSLLEVVMAARDRLIVTRDGYDVQTNQKVPAAVIVEELREAVLATVHPDDREAFADSLELAHPRQAFDEACFIPGHLVPGRAWGFDPGDLAGAEACRVRTHDPVPFLRVPLADQTADEPVETILLSDLHDFLANPVKAFVERRLGIRLPRDREPGNDILPVQPTGLEVWQIGQRLLTARVDDVSAEAWARVERQLGTLPPSLLGEELMAETGQTVDALTQRASSLGWQPGPGVPYPIDIAVDETLRIVGSVPCQLADPPGGRARIEFSRGRPSYRVAAWLDLLALTAADPSVPWRSVVVARGPAKGRPPFAVQLEARAEDAEGRRWAAARALRVIVDCYRQGLREPLPIFPTLSYKVHRDEAKPVDWSGAFAGRSDGDDPAVNLVFGGHDFASLMDLPAEERDPCGAGGRVAGLAHVLYGAMDDSVIDLVAESRVPVA